MFNLRFVAAVIGVLGEEEEVFVHGCLVSVLQASPALSACAVLMWQQLLFLVFPACCSSRCTS